MTDPRRSRDAIPDGHSRGGLTPEQRSQRARLAAYIYWANTPDPAARTAPAGRASLARFERQVDPDSTLDPAEHARRAEAAKRAYFTRLALRSALSRRKAAPARRRAAELDADTQAADAERAMPNRSSPCLRTEGADMDKGRGEAWVQLIREVIASWRLLLGAVVLMLALTPVAVVVVVLLAAR